jgi:serine phosphatase RsbU (regulator of sigma subunit)
VLRWTSPALVRRADGRVHRIDARGPLLGFLPDIRLADVRFRLAPGDTLLLYTDGATEARERPGSPQAARPLFGEDALADALAGTHRLDAATTISHLSQILALHTGGWASDDTALLALRVPPRP